MKRLGLGAVCLALALHAPVSAQETFRDPESQALGYKPLSGIEASPDFADDAHVFDNGGNLEETQPPKWQRTPAYEAYGAPEIFERDVSKAGVKQSLLRLRTQIGTSAAFASSASDNSNLLLASLLAEIDAYLGQLAAAKDFESLPAPEAEFQETQQSTADFSTETCYFAGTDHQVVLGGKRKSAGAPEMPGLSNKTPVYYATLRQAIEFRAVTDRIQVTFRAVKRKPFERVTARLADIDLGWSNYLEKGFSQYPWESVLNSYVTPKLFGAFAWDKAPHEQLVFLHPELGIELDTRSAQDASAQVSLMIHALGYIHYFGETRDWFLGASATMTFSDQDFGLGIGPTLHMGWANAYSILPHISVGAYWHDFESGGRGPILGFSLDFWRLLNKTSGASFYQAALPLSN
jgi:hypothetical protein